MYTFNLSSIEKGKQKIKAKKGLLKVDGPAVKSNDETTLPKAPDPSPHAPTDEVLDSRRELQNSKSTSSLSQTFQVLEKTNIQEKQLLAIQPTLEEFVRISLEFSR
jgi:hypothetical protein